MIRYLAFFAALALAAPAAAQLAGIAQVIDGDTLSFSGTPVRLHGIDAPEQRQTCQRADATWSCGEEASRHLHALVQGTQVFCRTRGTDDYGRTIAVCSAHGLELNRTMVAEVWATAFRNYSQDDIADEERAKAARAGIWSGVFQLPQDYRHVAEAHAEVQSRAALTHSHSRYPSGSIASPIGRCAIKANQNRKGQWIYHLPGMPYYEVTRAEAFFCTEAEARRAGYRRAIVR